MPFCNDNASSPDQPSSESGIYSDGEFNENERSIIDKQVANSVKNYNATMCDEKFTTESNIFVRRGRPKSTKITDLILKGTTSNSNIKCGVCCRVFPRLKSLQAHMRTHTGEFKENERSIIDKLVANAVKNCNATTCDENFATESTIFVRRGRPKSSKITDLIQKGTTSNSKIKCSECSRVFPRLKSLQAHMRTHTGERPYVCDYPLCMKPFKQSGQLKTHQRLHTREKPFACTIDGCDVRYTHSNRRCNFHPEDRLVRDAKGAANDNIENKDEEVLAWLKRYKEKTATKPPKGQKRKRVQEKKTKVSRNCKKMHFECTERSVKDENNFSNTSRSEDFVPETKSVAMKEGLCENAFNTTSKPSGKQVLRVCADDPKDILGIYEFTDTSCPMSEIAEIVYLIESQGLVVSKSTPEMLSKGYISFTCPSSVKRGRPETVVHKIPPMSDVEQSAVLGLLLLSSGRDTKVNSNSVISCWLRNLHQQTREKMSSFVKFI